MIIYWHKIQLVNMIKKSNSIIRLTCYFRDGRAKRSIDHLRSVGISREKSSISVLVQSHTACGSNLAIMTYSPSMNSVIHTFSDQLLFVISRSWVSPASASNQKKVGEVLFMFSKAAGELFYRNNNTFYWEQMLTFEESREKGTIGG